MVTFGACSASINWAAAAVAAVNAAHSASAVRKYSNEAACVAADFVNHAQDVTSSWVEMSSELVDDKHCTHQYARAALLERAGADQTTTQRDVCSQMFQDHLHRIVIPQMECSGGHEPSLARVNSGYIFMVVEVWCARQNAFWTHQSLNPIGM